MSPDRADRKKLKKAYLRKVEAVARQSLGLTEAQLKDLLGELDESIWGLGMPCDHTLGRTEEWAKRNGLDVERVLAATGWNKARAARVLEVDVKTLNKKIRDYNLVRPA